MWSCSWSLTCCHLSAELSHWWGGRRGRTGGGGAILWGATDRDGMGGPGEGTQGSQRRSNSPRSAHTRTSHSAHPPTAPVLQHFSFFSSCLFSLLHSHHVSISCYGGLTCACLCWTLPTTQINDKDSICFICKIAWLVCREMVQLKTTKWYPGQNKPLRLC